MGRYFLTGIPARACLMCCPHPAQVHLEQVLQVTFLHILTADSLLVHFLCSKYRSDDVTAMMLSQIMTLTSQLPQLSSLRNSSLFTSRRHQGFQNIQAVTLHAHMYRLQLQLYAIVTPGLWNHGITATTATTPQPSLVTGVIGRCCGRSH